MAVFRIEKTRDYTVMSNHHLKDRTLTLKSKGLLSMMLSLPDEWNYTTRGLAAICREGVDSIGAALKELETHGYIRRTQLRDEKGKITDTEYVIYEMPQCEPPSSPGTPLPGTAKPYTENPDMGIPDTAEPCTENPAQLNTKKSSKETSKTDLSSTELSNPIQSNPPTPAGARMGTDRMGARECYREVILDNIEYSYLVQDSHIDREQLDEIVDLIVDVLAHGLMDEADKKQVSTLLQSGRSNSEIAYWLSRAYSGEIETLDLETGDIADYRTTAQGIELEVMDAEEKRLAVLYFRWDEVAPLLRGMYARQLDGFGQERSEPVAEAPALHSETVAVYPGDKNNLPYDVVVERLHIEEPEPPAPVTEPEKTFEEVLDEHPVSIQVNGQWQTFPNAKAAEEASYEEYKANLLRNAQNFRITDEHLGEGGPKAKFQANINAIRLLKNLEAAGQQASPEQQEVLSRYVGWGGLADAFDPEKPAWAFEYAQLKELLTPEEYAAARSSTLNAHYTSPTVIQAIYEAVGRMGFETGNILEPSMGVGNCLTSYPMITGLIWRLN